MILRLILSLLLLSAISSAAWADPTCSVTEASSVTEADPQTVVFTPEAGSDRVVVVDVGARDNETTTVDVASVTSSAGGTYTRFDAHVGTSGGGDIRVFRYYSTDFAAGSQTLSVDYTGSVLTSTVAVYTCFGVNTASPWRGAATKGANGSASGTGSIDVPSAVGDLVLDLIHVRSAGTSVSPSAGAGQTAIYSIANAGDNDDTGASFEAGAAGNVTMSWTWTDGAGDAYVMLGGSLQPPPAASFGPLRRRGAQ